jgi:hypothetical protein
MVPWTTFPPYLIVSDVRLSALNQHLKIRGQENMHTWVAFLRGINVGDNTMVSMKDLAAICTNIGFGNVRTYLNSGNIIFTSPLSEGEIQQALEKELSARTGKEIGVVFAIQGILSRS